MRQSLSNVNVLNLEIFEIMCTELGTLEWRISRSMLDLLLFLNLETNLVLY